MTTRPKHIDRAMMTLREVALTHKSTLTGGELLEVSHYVAWLERQLAKRKQPSLWHQLKGRSPFLRLRRRAQ
jgi:hypothetical protein